MLAFLFALATVLVLSAGPALAQAPAAAPTAAPTPEPAAAPSAAPAAAPPAAAPETVAPDAVAPRSIPEAVRAFVATRRDLLGRACAATEVVTVGELHYVACGAPGMWVVRLAPDGSGNVVAVQDLGGDVMGFFEQGGELWARVTTQRATPILRIAPGAAQLSAPVPYAASPTSAPQPSRSTARPPNAKRIWGSVLQSASGNVVVNLGSNHGVRHGTHVAFYVIDRKALGGFEEVPRKRRIAVGVVDTVGAERSRVALGVAEHVDRGTHAELTSDPASANAVAPPRVGDVWE